MGNTDKEKQSADLPSHTPANFIYELNVSRRQLALYPAAHPKIIAGANKTLSEFKKLVEQNDPVVLGVRQNTLIFNGTLLDKENPTYRDLAALFSALDVVTISFYNGLTSAELIELLNLFTTQIRLQETGGLPLRLIQQQITHITLTTVDYRSFQHDTENRGAGSATEEQAWNDFVEEVRHHSRKADEEDQPCRNSLHADLLTQRLNEAEDLGAAGNTAIKHLISTIIEQGEDSTSALGSRIQELSKTLNPKMLQTLLESTLLTLDRNPQAAATAIQRFPVDFIHAALEHHNSNNLQLSKRLTDLLGTFAANTTETGKTPLPDSKGIKLAEQIGSNVGILLLEDQHDGYLPDNYQQALQKILNGKVAGTLADDVVIQLRNNLAGQMVERQCCDIIFDLLDDGVDATAEDCLQNNLVDLSRFFFDTGDFSALRKTLIQWMAYLHSGYAKTRILNEKVMGTHLKKSFMEDVLNAIPIWQEEKHAEICDYLREVGTPYAELLIDFLGKETDAARRKIWMKLLLELGAQAHQTILETMHDSRWFLVRNLLVVLGQQKGGLPIKTTVKLCDHSHPKVRREALRILFRSSPSTANRQLMKELSVDDRTTLLIMIPLAELSDDENVFKKLNTILESMPLNVKTLEVKLCLIATVAQCTNVASLPILIRLATQSTLFRNQLRKKIQQSAAAAVAKYPHNLVIPLLTHLGTSKTRILKKMIYSSPPSGRE